MVELAARGRDEARARLLRAVQAERRKAGIEDADYRALLERLTGKRSAADMNAAELARVLAGLTGKPAPARKLAKPWARKIARLWEVALLLGAVPADQADGMAGFVKAQTGKDHLDWLLPGESSAVIEALRARIARAGWDVPAGAAATSQPAQCAYARALWARLQMLGMQQAPGDGLGTWLQHSGVSAGVVRIEGLSADQVGVAVRQLEAWMRRATGVGER